MSNAGPALSGRSSTADVVLSANRVGGDRNFFFARLSCLNNACERCFLATSRRLHWHSAEELPYGFVAILDGGSVSGLALTAAAEAMLVQGYEF